MQLAELQEQAAQVAPLQLAATAVLLPVKGTPVTATVRGAEMAAKALESEVDPAQESMLAAAAAPAPLRQALALLPLLRLAAQALLRVMLSRWSRHTARQPHRQDTLLMRMLLPTPLRVLLDTLEATLPAGTTAGRARMAMPSAVRAVSAASR